VWIIDDLSTGLHPDQWLGGSLQVGASGRAVEYHVGERIVTFIHEDLSVTMLKQLGTITGERVDLPSFDFMFALASVVGGRVTIEGDPMHVAVDLAIDALFFLWLVRNKEKVGKVLYASSSAAYPIKLQAKSGHVALREEMIDFTTGELGQPDMTYGWSKLTGEYLSHLAARQYGVHIACVRPFSGYGEDQDLSYPVPAIAYRVARGDDPVTVWGTGEQGRDFVHIEDCITAMVLSIDRIGDGSGINIGSGTLTTFLEVAGLFVRLDGRRATVRPTIGMPVGVQSRYCDPSRMAKALGWRPRISLEEGFQRVLDAAHQRVHLLGKAAIA
jgi:nucleoside-diphosphate-sugar epimerase